MKTSIYFLLIIVPFFVQCKTPQKNSNKMNSYEYIDGSGNLFAINSTTIIYDPITPEESSTGTYSGGEPYKINVESKQFEDLEKVFKKVIANTNGQTTERNKGTGTLVVLPERITYIFEMNSDSKKEIEEAIKMVTKR